MEYNYKIYIVGVSYKFRTPATLTLEANNTADAMIKASELLKEMPDDIIIEMTCREDKSFA